MDFIIDNFEMLFDNEEHLKKLEEIILDLAVKGKLVPQNADDEPASVLLEKIKEEKEILIKEKKIKKDTPLESIKDEEKTFEIPENWEWVRLGEIGTIERGITFPSSEKKSEMKKDCILCATTASVQESFQPFRGTYVNKKFVKNEEKTIKNEDILISLANSYELVGKSCFVENIKNEMTFGGFIAAIRVAKISKKYFYYYLQKMFFSFQLQVLSSQTTNIANLNNEKLNNILIAIPPLAEQKRIVEKVDSLKNLIETLKEKVKSRDNSRQNLKKSIMAEIEKSDSNIDLLNNLEMVFRNFDVVVKNKSDIKDIRDLILSMAVKGKLVPQNADDEPASVLLEKIKTEKERLIKEKKIKKDIPLEPIKDEEKPFEIPESWEWVRLQDVTNLITCGYASTPQYVEKGKPFISAKNVKPYRFLHENHNYISEELFDRLTATCKPEINDILVTRVGAGIGEAALIDRDLDFAIYVSLTLVKPVHKYIDSKFLLHYILSDNCNKSLLGDIYGKNASQGNLNVSKMRSLVTILPPLAEQKRIVEKVEKLMKYCDELEKKVEESRKEKEMLTRSIVQGMIG